MLPYKLKIEELSRSQRDKDAELLVLKYALLEADRKFQELEKKLKTAGPGGASRAAPGTSRAALGGSRGAMVKKDITIPNGS